MASGIQIRDATGNIMVDTTTYFYKAIDVTQYNVTSTASIPLPAAFAALPPSAVNVRVYTTDLALAHPAVSITATHVNLAPAAGTKISARLIFEAA